MDQVAVPNPSLKDPFFLTASHVLAQIALQLTYHYQGCGACRRLTAHMEDPDM